MWLGSFKNFYYENIVTTFKQILLHMNVSYWSYFFTPFIGAKLSNFKMFSLTVLNFPIIFASIPINFCYFVAIFTKMYKRWTKNKLSIKVCSLACLVFRFSPTDSRFWNVNFECGKSVLYEHYTNQQTKTCITTNFLIVI